ncbi:MAG TPA: 2-hydroxychromene-2-carboxylate isomerase [Thiolinea sp.]|nr:2-hydroxychromene-2-carboxylate isomerase [Thiolinea sp.]
MLDFYFDFYSPYGYLAAHRIDAIAGRYGREVKWHAILLGPAFKAVGARPLVDIPLIGAYSRHDFARTARLEGMPFVMPPTFPGATLAAARAFHWLDEQDPVLAKTFARAVYQAAFGEGRDILDVQQLAQVAAGCGVDAGAMQEAIRTDAVKARLKAEVDASLARGVFGSPFVIVDGEAFWGNDRLVQVEEWLRRGGW